jgi:hypothetical protein
MVEAISMGNTFQVSRDVSELISAIKRARPSDWILTGPSPKRIRLTPFEDNGAKAVKINEGNVVIHVK